MGTALWVLLLPLWLVWRTAFRLASREQSGHPVRHEIRALLFCFEISKRLSEYSRDFLQCNSEFLMSSAGFALLWPGDVGNAVILQNVGTHSTVRVQSILCPPCVWVQPEPRAHPGTRDCPHIQGCAAPFK